MPGAGRRRAGLPAAARPRRLQAGQRRRRPRGGRPPARPGGRPAARHGAGRRPGRPARRRRVRRPGARRDRGGHGAGRADRRRPADGAPRPRRAGVTPPGSSSTSPAASASPSSTRPTTCRRPSARPTSRCARPRRPGKSCVRTAGHAIDSATGRRTRLARDLPAALEQEQFRVVYQPVVGVAERRILGLEALVRWDHPVLGHRAARRVHLPGRGRRPDRDPAALGAARATTDAAALLAAGWDVQMGVNVSVATCRPAAWPPTSPTALAASGLPPAQAHPRDHRVGHARRRGPAGERPRHAARDGLRPVRRRLRPRLLVAGLPGPAAGRHPQDGPRVHRRHRAATSAAPRSCPASSSWAAGSAWTSSREGVETVGQLRVLREMGCATCRAGCSAGRWTVAELTPACWTASTRACSTPRAERGNGHWLSTQWDGAG